MQVEYKGKKEFLRTYTPPQVWPDQPHFAAILKRLTRDKNVSIHFLTGHYERNIMSLAGREYGYHTTQKSARRALINEGVDADTISLAGNSIPANTNLLVVADPKSDYSAEEKQKLIDYLREGNNAIFYLEPGKQFILAPVLETIGVYPENGMIVSPNEHEMPHIFQNMLTRSGNFLAKEAPMELFQQYGIRGGMVENEGSLNLRYEAIDGFTIEPVITQPGNDKTWIENGVLVVDSAAPVFDAGGGDQKKEEYLIALKLSRKIGNREQRIIVTGDADFMGINRMKVRTIHSAFYSWLLYNRYPVYTNYPLAPDLFLKISSTTAKLITGLYVYIGSGILLLGAIMLLTRRKRK
jgi:ABC-2 type transport system permease protein